MAAIQVQSVERALAPALVITDMTTQSLWRRARLRRMAVFLQQAVSVAPATANTIAFAISAKFDRGAQTANKNNPQRKDGRRIYVQSAPNQR
jgi:hypothetical protein